MSSSFSEETLRTIYYDPNHPAAFGSVSRLYQAARNVVPSITLAFVKQWILGQNVYTLHAPLNRRFPRRKTLAPGLYYQMQMDLVDLSNIKNKNNGFTFLLTAIDVFSRKAFVVPLKSKRGSDVRDAIANIFTNYPPPKYVQTDSGKEFYNHTVMRYLKQLNIRLFSTSSDTKCALVERFNRTLKQKMFKYFTANQTVRYVPVLQQMVSAYNNRPHRSIGISPNKVTLMNQSAIWHKQYYRYLTGYRKGVFKYSLGDDVRISKLARQFRKGYLPSYTDETFVVHQRLATAPVTYKLKDTNGEVLIGSFYEAELQRVILPLS